MIFGLLLTFFVFVCFLLVLVILVQQSKGGLGLGSLGGGAQMLFGGSGGTDVFQKITWILGSLFMIGSLVLALMKAPSVESRQLAQKLPMQHVPVQSGSVPEPID